MSQTILRARRESIPISRNGKARRSTQAPRTVRTRARTHSHTAEMLPTDVFVVGEAGLSIPLLTAGQLGLWPISDRCAFLSDWSSASRSSVIASVSEAGLVRVVQVS